LPLFRKSKNGQDPIVTVDAVEQIVPEIRGLLADRWHSSRELGKN
jgi:hypothetical protein